MYRSNEDQWIDDAKLAVSWFIDVIGEDVWTERRSQVVDILTIWLSNNSLLMELSRYLLHSLFVLLRYTMIGLLGTCI